MHEHVPVPVVKVDLILQLCERMYVMLCFPENFLPEKFSGDQTHYPLSRVASLVNKRHVLLFGTVLNSLDIFLCHRSFILDKNTLIYTNLHCYKSCATAKI